MFQPGAVPVEGRGKRWAPVPAILAAMAAALMTAPRTVTAQQVYVGTGNGRGDLVAHPDQWTFVRRNADGFYVNFIEMLNPDAEKCAQLSALFSHKNAYYESDSRYKGLGGFPDGGQFTRALQAKELNALLEGGFKVPYTSLNYGVDNDKLADLKSQGLPAGTTRPCFAQYGPWTIGGDITKDSGNNPRMRAEIGRTDGISTDGPLSLWQADQGHMQSGSYSLVRYAHSLGKTAAVMVAPYNLKPATQWLSVAQQCVRQHENAGAKPDIWIVFEYATKTPALPELVNDQPATTTTGMAYWLIKHLKDPDHWARLTAPTVKGTPLHTVVAGTPTSAGPTEINLAVPVAGRPGGGSSARQVIGFAVRNQSKWMDLCPVLFARIKCPQRDWSVHFQLSGQDVTRQMMQAGGLSFVGDLRLWPGNRRQVQMVLECKHPGAGSQRPMIEIGLRPHPSARGRISQLLVLRPTLRRASYVVASRP